jgi:S1 RNA binding domain protein
MSLEVGMILKGKVTGISKFGAFVTLENGKSGMVHISEISSGYVTEIKDHISEGQEVRVKVIGIDEKGRINLSIKKAVSLPEQEKPRKTVSFEDMLSKFKQESDEKFADNKLTKENRKAVYEKRTQR